MGVRDVDWSLRQLGEVHALFDAGRDIVLSRAPGRLDVMGGIADYSGSLVLEMPIAEATFAAVQKVPGETVECVSVDYDGKRFSTFEMKLADLMCDGRPHDLASARHYFANREGGDWASYVAGAFFVLAKELGVQGDTGARIVVASRVPIGKGVASSAALEVSVMQAVCSAFEIEMMPRDLALLCQQVENHIDGETGGTEALSDAAAMLVDQLRDPATVAELVERYASACELEPAEVRGGVIDFVRQSLVSGRLVAGGEDT